MPAADDFNQTAAPEEDWFALGDSQFKAVPRAASSDVIVIRGILPLVIGDNEGFRARQDKIEAALLILSQSPTARKLAATAIAAGYQLVVDPPVIGGAGTSSENVALGSTNSLSKRINLRGSDDPVNMAIVIAHELAHVSQFINGRVPTTVSAYHPLASIRNLLAMEGDARAHEFMVALELSYAAKGDPDGRLLFPQAIDIAANNIGGILPKKIIEHFKPRFPDDIDTAEMMARIFKSFYGSPDLRQHYENTILHAMSTVEKLNPGALADEKLFTKDIPTSEIIANIDRHTKPYVERFAKFIDLDSPTMTALSQETLEKLAALQKIRLENPLTQSERPWNDAPSFADVAQKPEAPKPPAPKAPLPKAFSP